MNTRRWVAAHQARQPEQQRQPTSRYRIPPSDYPLIADRARGDESLSSIAREYGVTRERIRQIAALEGVHKHEMARQRVDDLCAQYAEEIIYHREAWQPVVWKDQEVTKEQWRSWISTSDLEDRWNAAKDNPRSQGVVCPDGRICALCRVWDVWDGFYFTKGGINGRAHVCKECTKERVMYYHKLRNVETPTVTEKECPKCGEVLPASAFNRSRRNNSGLQTYCLPCHNSFPSQHR